MSDGSRREEAPCAVCGSVVSFRKIGGEYPRRYFTRGPDGLVNADVWLCKRACDDQYRGATGMDRPAPVVDLTGASAEARESLGDPAS